ncbi:MAG: hypothetical protein DMG65_04785 [Candidatus Angelobacter sp. Gp1-AA117]|nr:MAG: hypothetical protein DMG65_04785 [Candidatus Angelobacter sp. Gp1-AA117]
MKLLSLNPRTVLLPVLLAAISACAHGVVHSKSSSTLHKGLIIEHLTSHFDAEKAGMKVGDVLLYWTRGEDKGELASPLDFLYLRYAEATRGRLRIDGISGGRKRSWYLGSDVWGIWPRPNFSGLLLGQYQQCQTLPKGIDQKKRMECWQAVAAEARTLPVEWLVPWVLSQAAYQFGINGLQDAMDQSYKNTIEEISSDAHNTRGQLLLQWGRAFSSRDDLAQAGIRFGAAVQEWSQVGADNVAVAEPLLEFGLTALNQGNYETAEEAWEHARTILERFAPRSLEMILAYGNLAVLYQQRGDLTKAEDYYRRAVAKERTYLPGSQYLPQQLTNLGTLVRARGDLAAAEMYHEQALAALNKVGINNEAGANIFDNLADCALDRNDLRKAEQYQRRALAIRQKLGLHNLDVAASLTSLGIIAERKGTFKLAERYYRKSRAIQEQIAPESPAIADVVAGLGRITLSSGDLMQAEQYFRDALALLEKVAPASLRHNEVSANLAQALHQAGRLDESATIYRHILADLENKTTQLAVFGENQSRYRARHAAYYREYIDLLLEQGKTELAFETLESSHARTLYDMLSAYRIDVAQGVDPALLNQEHNLRQSIAQKSQYKLRLLARKYTDEQISGLDREISSLRDQYEQLGAQIRMKTPAYAALIQPQSLTLATIQGTLDSDSVLLEYSLGERHSSLWLVTDHSLKIYELPPRKRIENLARQVYESFSTHRDQIGSEAAGAAEYNRAASDLSRIILGPIAENIGDKKLLIVSDGALQYVPFAALPIPRKTRTGVDGRPVILDHEVINLPSASVIAELRRFANERIQPLKKVAVLADPVFEIEDERISSSRNKPSTLASFALNGHPPQSDRQMPVALRRSFADVRTKKTSGFYLNRLLYTRREAHAIMALVPKGKGLEILDFGANRASALNADLGNYEIVHFATHGLLDSKHPELSGLVLSLVDKNGKSQNGFLQLEDIYNLKLPVELVVLSGCQTGLGQDVSGEGLIGLTRGFMYAGASRVVATLWNINDVATSEFMGLFYKAMLRDGLRPAAALRKAQIEMLRQKQWKSPYYWAAFELQGEWN